VGNLLRYGLCVTVVRFGMLSRPSGAQAGHQLQTRLDAFNILNHPNWNNSFSTDPSSIDFGTFGKGPNGPGTPVRDLQISGNSFGDGVNEGVRNLFQPVVPDILSVCAGWFARIDRRIKLGDIKA
jgi:hypothetical protein